jgi:hypothetical protein
MTRWETRGRVWIERINILQILWRVEKGIDGRDHDEEPV